MTACGSILTVSRRSTLPWSHVTGDELLRQVSQRLQASLCESDMAACIGGDGFTVVLATVIHSEDAAGRRKKNHRPNAFGPSLSRKDRRRSRSALASPFIQTMPVRLRTGHCTDLAMYAAKNAGKNGW